MVDSMDMDADVERQDTVKRKRQQLFADFNSNVTLHGFRYLFAERGFRRFVWIIALLSSTILSVVLFYSALSDYLLYKTFTVFATEFNTKDADFPTVTVCSLNAASRKKLSNLPINKTADEFIFHVSKLFPGVSKVGPNWTDPEFADLFQQLAEANVTSVRGIMNLYELGIEQLLSDDIGTAISNSNFSCAYEGEKCNPKDFKEMLSWSLSMCHQFNYYEINKKTLTSKAEGFKTGLTMFFDLHTAEMVYAKYPFQGLALFIHQYGVPSYLPSSTKMVVVQPGSMNFIELSQKKITLLPPPYSSKCGKAHYKIIKGYPYSKSMCMTDCILYDVSQKCGCVGFEFEGFVGDVPTCTVKQTRCYSVRRNIMRDDVYNYCDSGCPEECIYYKYHVTSSQAALGARFTVEKIKKIPGWKLNHSETETYIKESIVGVHIGFYGSTSLKESVMAAVTWTSLLATIGGDIGLCLGFSILTAFEFIFFFYDYLAIPWKKKKLIE